jgi:uncharacterized sulfatase
MLPMSGQSISRILTSEREGLVDGEKKYVFAGRERHSASRYLNWGYPQRVIRSKDYLLIWNLKPERWPAGAPQRLKPGTEDELYPLYGINEQGQHNSAWAFTDIDGSPTKSFLVENHADEAIRPYFEWAVALRPEFELFDVRSDPSCLSNLAGNPEYSPIETEMKQALLKELKKSKDPRIVGPDKEVFDSYLRYSPMREFPVPSQNRL